MQYLDLDQNDNELLASALAKLHDVFESPDHMLIAAVRTDQNNTHFGVNLKLHNVKRASMCAEPGAISSAVLDHQKPSTIVAVRKSSSDGEAVVANPCGLCREMFTDYYPDLRVIVSTSEGVKKCLASDLLPLKF